MKTLLIFSLFAVFLLGAGCSRKDTQHQAHEAATVQSEEIYTCPMHPSVISNKPGACPVCGMALVRKSAAHQFADTTLTALGRIALSSTQRVLANITTQAVTRTSLRKTITTVGVVEYAEPLQMTIAARFRGRIEKLFVSYTGQEVRLGEPLFDLYSPDVVSAQQEFLSSLEAYQRAVAMGDETNRILQQRLLDASRDRLRTHFGMTDAQLADLEASRRYSSTVRFYSPMTGTVVLKQVQEGQYVDEGMILYQLVNLSRVWVYVDVYEKDLRFVRPGQPIRVISESYPDRTFSGVVTFVDPVINNETRTARVRAEFANPDALLKPKMFVRAELTVPLPNILAVPASAVLITGRRAVVWVEVSPNTFEPRTVQLGASSDSYYEIISGLKEGEQVAISGGFLLDSESALQMSTTSAHSGHTSTRAGSERSDALPGEPVRILVKGRYIPDVIHASRGKTLILQFYRDEDSDCTNEVVFDDFGIRRTLPARQVTTVELTPREKGEFRFTCGMGMVHGRLIVD